MLTVFKLPCTYTYLNLRFTSLYIYIYIYIYIYDKLYFIHIQSFWSVNLQRNNIPISDLLEGGLLLSSYRWRMEQIQPETQPRMSFVNIYTTLYYTIYFYLDNCDVILAYRLAFFFE